MLVYVTDRVIVLVVFVRHDLDAAVSDPAGRQQAIGHPLQLVAATSQDDDLEAPPIVEVDVEGRSNTVAQLVLELRQLLGELANVEVINERQRRYGRGSPGDLGARHLGPGQVAQDLRAGHASLLDDLVQVLEQRPLHRDAEPDEIVLHPGQVRSRRPGCRY